MEIRNSLLTKNDCYKEAKKIVPKGIVVHSTGANNPYLKRYVQPDDGVLGVNAYGNSWNRSGIETCVHAFIGKDKSGAVRCYQTLPWEYAAWGVGRGSKGSYNYAPTGHIQFEICEDGLTDSSYFEAAFSLAAQLCAYLCEKYALSAGSVVSHAEAAKRGYASAHADCDHWLAKFGKTMDDFRTQVRELLSRKETTTASLTVGTLVRFKGGKHYATASATEASGTPSAGEARITAVSEGARHPYHLVHTDASSSVYGWVDADRVEKKASATGASTYYRVQVGAFTSEVNAEAMQKKLKAAGFDAVVVRG